MPCYFIDISHQGTIDHAKEPQELLNLDAAREEAFAGARQIVANALLDGSSLKEALDGSAIVKSMTGEVLHTVTFTQSVEGRTSLNCRATAEQ